MILIISLILTCISIMLLIMAPATGVLASIIFKPIIDLAWKSQYAFLGLRPIDLIGAGLPTLLLLRMIVSKAGRPRRMMMLGVWSFYMFTNFLGATMMIASGDLIGPVSFIFRVLNGFVGFYMLQTYFANRDRFRSLLIALIIAGLFPMFMGLYESVTGDLFRVRYGVGDQIRIAGLYHNSISYRYFAYMTLTAIGLYWAYFKPRSTVVRSMLIGLSAVTLIVLFNVYSKAGYASLLVAAILASIAARRIVPLIFAATLLFMVNFAMEGLVVDQVSVTFSKETGVIGGEYKTDRLFQGRVAMWKEQLSDWDDLSFENKLFGGHSGGRGARAGGHNDFIRALLQTGLVGLSAYVFLLMAIGLRVSRLFMRERSPINTVAIIVFCVWVIDSIGLTPAVFTHFQWYVWGFVGLAFHGIKGMPPDNMRSNTEQIGERQPHI